ncbi:MAG TPA: hypothetical protein VJ742_13270 [Nitrososphaera sp.]|nr:hypothetical protein [Nitrososphaera sp.]
MHKQLGYGLTDIQFEKDGYVITDERLNPSGMAMDHSDYWYSRTVLDYRCWMEEQLVADFNGGLERAMLDHYLKGINAGTYDAHDFEPRQAVTMNVEYGEPVLLIRPLYQRDWLRYDNTIDWVQETYCNGEERQHNWVKILPDGIFPYNGLFMDARTGEDVDLNEAVLYKRLLSPEWGKVPTPEEIDKIFEANVFPKTPRDVLENMAPRVPKEVRSMCEYGQIFNDPATILDLRPMLYCWWG